jgi:hypothetical protein
VKDGGASTSGAGRSDAMKDDELETASYEWFYQAHRDDSHDD